MAIRHSTSRCKTKGKSRKHSSSELLFFRFLINRSAIKVRFALERKFSVLDISLPFVRSRSPNFSLNWHKSGRVARVYTNKLIASIMSLPEDSCQVAREKCAVLCPHPPNCDPCGAACAKICGTTNPNLTCRPAGRAWGRACGPVAFKCGQWTTPVKKLKNCSPVVIFGCRMKRLPYGFGLYARKLYPCGLPCVGTFCLPKPRSNQIFYPMLPTKPGKIYSSYTFQMRGPPYTCPRPCIARGTNK